MGSNETWNIYFNILSNTSILFFLFVLFNFRVKRGKSWHGTSYEPVRVMASLPASLGKASQQTGWNITLWPQWGMFWEQRGHDLLKKSIFFYCQFEILYIRDVQSHSQRSYCTVYVVPNHEPFKMISGTSWYGHYICMCKYWDMARWCSTLKIINLS